MNTEADVNESFQIVVVNQNQRYNCGAKQSLLIGMERRAAKKSIQVGCRGGGCGVCKIRIISGHYHCKPMSRAHVTVEESEAGFALACRVYPRSDMEIEADHYQVRKAAAKQRTAADFVTQFTRSVNK